jgi:Predicted esterase
MNCIERDMLKTRRESILLMVAALSIGCATPAVATATIDDGGILVHEIESPFQEGKTQIRVLLPKRRQSGHFYPVVYVLPVEARNENEYGNGLLEIKTHDLQNRYDAIFVAPTFSRIPWYADHPTDPLIRQESYFLKIVVPFVERTYPALADPRGRLLLGFSKSGWGAWSLLLRHPDVFGRAAAWDAPLMMAEPNQYPGSVDVFATRDNLANYRIERLVRERAKTLGSQTRLMLMGYGGFREQHRQMHEVLQQLQIPHDYRDGPERKHDWHSGWVTEAVEWLVSKAEVQPAEPKIVVIYGDSITACSALTLEERPHLWVNQVEVNSKGMLRTVNEGKGGRPTGSLQEFEETTQSPQSCCRLSSRRSPMTVAPAMSNWD